MKKKLSILIPLCLVLATIVGCGNTKVPFKSLQETEIKSAAVTLQPSNETKDILETKELVEYFQDIVLYEKSDEYRELNGQICTFTITKTDGTELEVMISSEYVVIDGVGYKSDYNICEKINEYANSLLK